MKWQLRLAGGAAAGVLCGPCVGASTHLVSAPSDHRPAGWARMQDRMASCTLEELGQQSESSLGTPRVCVPVLLGDHPEGTVLGPDNVLPALLPADFVPSVVELRVLGRRLASEGFSGEMLRPERLQ